MYQALYRKYRPSTFDDVISQPHVTTALTNQIISGKTAHAYLFTGSRGTGKTTCARIFAKAINCEHPVNGNPCNECSICRDADNFALSDIIEIDAASNNTVNDARELREGTIYTPERCKYKIYIIDEVHMLSKEAFNALLKIIEEPPPHIKFIMATTELHKVLPTILSRCQRFDFRRIRTEDIAERLLQVADKEGISLEADAAALIAKAADGGMRDALSILDRCIAFSDNITGQIVSEAAGIADREYVFKLCEAIADKNPSEALGIISRLYDCSKDMTLLCEELITQFRNIMIAASAPDRTDVIFCLPSELETIKEIAEKMPLADIMADIDALGKCSERMSRSLSKRIDLEMCVIAMCSGIHTSDNSSVNKSSVENDRGDSRTVEILKGRVAALEQRISEGYQPQNTRSRQSAGGAITSAERVTDTSSLNRSKLKAFSGWDSAVKELSRVYPSISSTLTCSRAFESDQSLFVETDNRFFIQLLRQEDNKNKLLETVSNVSGNKYTKVFTKCVPNLSELIDTHVETASVDADSSAPTQTPLDVLLKKAEEAGVPVETSAT